MGDTFLAVNFEDEVLSLAVSLHVVSQVRKHPELLRVGCNDGVLAVEDDAGFPRADSVNEFKADECTSDVVERFMDEVQIRVIKIWMMLPSELPDATLLPQLTRSPMRPICLPLT